MVRRVQIRLRAMCLLNVLNETVISHLGFIQKFRLLLKDFCANLCVIWVVLDGVVKI
jgi:hypothetical protein